MYLDIYLVCIQVYSLEFLQLDLDIHELTHFQEIKVYMFVHDVLFHFFLLLDQLTSSRVHIPTKKTILTKQKLVQVHCLDKILNYHVFVFHMFLFLSLILGIDVHQTEVVVEYIHVP